MKKVFAFLLLCLLLLCSASTGYCRGTLSEQDGFETYIGKSRSEVRIIARGYETLQNGQSLLVDMAEEGKVALIVDFNEDDVADMISAAMVSDFMENDLGGDLYKMFSFGIFLLGIDSEDMIDIEEKVAEDGSPYLYGLFKGQISCAGGATGTLYAVSCTKGSL